ncbi:MAG: pantoate--beta-alanine ligase [Reichenbachiella sp.]|uniref:pantoate--beta-alanine ligase n=1 Tax=Reichenbachiella sp. TaxID=2184521 RepID=UPI003264E70F
MKIFSSITQLRHYLDFYRRKGDTIGLVPTMGALHEGHGRLVNEAVKSCNLTVCSIFVNPTQFNNPDDLANYPKQIDADKKLLAAKGCDAVFLPTVDEMYPDEKLGLAINFGQLEQVLEGEFRPGHFSGVGVVVSKLLNIVQPDIAYFGQKDLQQLAIINRLVKDLSIQTKIVAVSTVRESSGLAMSSRNLRLSKEEKVIASELYQAMLELKKSILMGVATARAIFETKEKLNELEGLRLEYLEIVNAHTMDAITDLSASENVSICTAAYVGKVRIIDNLYIKQED